MSKIIDLDLYCYRQSSPQGLISINFASLNLTINLFLGLNFEQAKVCGIFG
jgi:hypothetical protein